MAHLNMGGADAYLRPHFAAVFSQLSGTHVYLEIREFYEQWKS